MLSLNHTRRYLKKRVLVQVQGGPELKPAGILPYSEELKQGTNTEIGPKNFFEIASHGFLAVRHLAMWNRILRLMAVGRNLCFAAVLGLVLCYWIVVSDVFGWQKSSGVFSSALYGLLSCWGFGIIVLAFLDARSRFQDYKRAKDLFFENGFKSRIAKIYIRSKCQRDAARVAAKDLGLLEQLDSFYRSRGYRWYHIFPDFIFKMPWIVFSGRYWRKTLFEPQYTSYHFLW